jgi:hypothetical protein
VIADSAEQIPLDTRPISNSGGPLLDGLTLAI